MVDLAVPTLPRPLWAEVFGNTYSPTRSSPATTTWRGKLLQWERHSSGDTGASCYHAPKQYGNMPKDTDGDHSSVACGIVARQLKDTDGDPSSVASGSGAGIEAVSKVKNQEDTAEEMLTSGACSSGMMVAGTGEHGNDTRYRGLGAIADDEFVIR